MASSIEEELIQQIVRVAETASRSEKTVVVSDDEDRLLTLNDIDAIESIDAIDAIDNNDNNDDDDLPHTTKSLPFTVGKCDDSRRAILKSLPTLETQDSFQKLQSSPISTKHGRQPRRRRRSLKDSLTSLFSSASLQHKRSPSPRCPQRSSSAQSRQSFSLSSLVSSKRRSLHRRKSTRSRRRFSAANLELDMHQHNSALFRQSSSTAFTSAALEVSEGFKHQDIEDDREEQLSLPFRRSHDEVIH